MKRSKTVTVGELLDEFFQRPYVAAKVAEGRLRDTWREIVGPAADAETPPVRRSENHILHVRIRSSILRNELFYQREALGAKSTAIENPTGQCGHPVKFIFFFVAALQFSADIGIIQRKMYFCTLEAKIQTKTAYFYDKAKRAGSTRHSDE